MVGIPTTTDLDAVPPSANAAHPLSKLAGPSHPRHGCYLLVTLVLCIAAVGFVLLVVLWIQNAFPGSQTNSTIDALVSGHVTSVSPRVDGQVRRVLVRENDRVNQGDLLIELDSEPFEVQVSIKQAAVAAAEADLVVAQAQARALVAQVRANRYKLAQAVEDVNSQIANLGANVAALGSKKATLELAQTNLRRGEELAPNGVISKEEIIKRRQTVEVAEAAVEEALHEVNATRASIGLSPRTAQSLDLADVPADQDQADSSVRQSLLELLQSLALLGYSPPSWKATPQQVIEDFYKRDPDGDLDRIFAQLIARAPAMQQAEAKLLQARRDLEQAELMHRSCGLVSAIQGVVINRDVNPGDNVEARQSLIALSSLADIWITVNMPVTERQRLRLGRRVRCEVDTPGGRREVEGHIAGWSSGTIAKLTQNVHRGSPPLVVRIDLDNYQPGDDPLFVGLPVVVDFGR
jgi:membrane fusion protein, multidrug efflux system